MVALDSVFQEEQNFTESPKSPEPVISKTPKKKKFVMNKPMKGLFHYADRHTLDQHVLKPLARGLGPTVDSNWKIANSKASASFKYASKIRALNQVCPMP